MKYLLLLSIFAYVQVSCAEVNKHNSIKSNKLDIYASRYDGKPIDKPQNWLRFYEHENITIENRIYITASFNIRNVTTLVITDLNAEKKLCGTNQKKFLQYLAFEPDTNLKKVTTRISKPCFVKNQAVLKLNVKTQDGQRLYNIVSLTAHPNAFDPVSE